MKFEKKFELNYDKMESIKIFKDDDEETCDYAIQLINLCKNLKKIYISNKENLLPLIHT